MLSATGEVKRIARTGSWLLDLPVRPSVTIEEEIEVLLSSFPVDEQVWLSLGERYRVDLLCDVFVKGVNRGFELSPQVLVTIGRRRINFGVDIYCEYDDVQQAALSERLGGN
jgi:hypothetical protein